MFWDLSKKNWLGRTGPSPQMVFKTLTWICGGYDKDLGGYSNSCKSYWKFFEHSKDLI